MKKLFIHSMILLAALLAGYRQVCAQSVLGSWVKTAEVLTHADGKTVNSFDKLKKAMPCMTSIVYSFFTAGKMKEDASACPAMVRQTGESLDSHVSWKQQGDLVFLDVSINMPVRHEVFHLRFNGNDEMVWTFIYAENKSTPNPFRAKQLETTYRRK